MQHPTVHDPGLPGVAPDHTLYAGNDGKTDYLLTVYDDGEMEMTARPVLEKPTWPPPETLAPRPALTLLRGGAA